MRYIPLREANKDELEAWLAKANTILEQLKNEPDCRKRKAIIFRNRSHWRDVGLLEFLKSLSHGKCWYTEAKFTAEYPHLEHFRPKSCARNENWEKCHDGYWWLAFDLENYRLSKPLPNTRKGTYFPLRQPRLAVCEPGIALTLESPFFLDPYNEDDVALLGFNALGKPEPCREPPVDLDDWDRKRIEFSIKHYGLDDRDLCDQRKALWIAISALCDEYAQNVFKAKHEQCLESRGKAKQIMAQLRNYLDPRHEFTALIRDCFNTHKVGRSLFPHLVSTQIAA